MDSKAPLASTGCMVHTQTAVVQDGSLKESGGNRGRLEAADRETLVVVQREWNGWRTAMVMLTDLEDVRWLQPNGAPRPLIHAYVSCSKLQSGDLQHDCDLMSAPQRLLVCVLKSHTAPYVFENLARLASKADARQMPDRSVAIASAERDIDVLTTTESTT
jgi:hypothetical protein